MGASSSPHWPRPSPHAIAGPSAATASSDCTPHTHTHAPDIVTIYYQYIFPPVQRLQQAPAGGSVSCTTQQQSNSLAAPLPQPPPTEPSQTIHQTTQQYTTTYIHTRTKYCDNPPPTHPPACTNTTNYACTNVCLGVSCVWERRMRRRTTQDHSNQHGSTAAARKYIFKIRCPTSGDDFIVSFL